MPIPQGGNFFQPGIEAITKPQAPASAGGGISRTAPVGVSTDYSKLAPGSCQTPNFSSYIIKAVDLNSAKMNRLIDIPGEVVYIAQPWNGLTAAMIIHFDPIDALSMIEDPTGNRTAPGLRVAFSEAGFYLFKFCCGFPRFYVSWGDPQNGNQAGDVAILVFASGIVDRIDG